LPAQCIEYVRKSRVIADFMADLRAQNFAEFTIVFSEKVGGELDHGAFGGDGGLDNEGDENLVPKRVDKTMKIGRIEYYLGVPIKERPIRIEFLKSSPYDQVIAGTVRFLTKREYVKKDAAGSAVVVERVNEEGETVIVEEKRPYWTFVLDDGRDKAQCVFFPNTKTRAKFETIIDGTFVCVVGQNQEKGGRTSFMVRGLSLASR